MRMELRTSGLLVLALLLASCAGAPTADEPSAAVDEPAANPTATALPEATELPEATAVPEAETGGETMAFELTSSAFSQGSAIPTRYSCDGEDVSPPLRWSEPPAEAEALALIMDDPDAPAGTWDHWILFNLPAGAGELAEGIEAVETREDGSVHGANSWGRLGYGGPCPPGGTHRYFFKLYALDQPIELGPGTSKGGLLSAMEGHILEQVELMGTYER